MANTKWVNEAGTPIGLADESDYFEGDAQALAERLNGHVVKDTQIGVLLALPCGVNCLKREGCWTYRSFYPM